MLKEEGPLLLISTKFLKDAGRHSRLNIMRADPIRNVDIGIIKNTQVAENVRAQLWVDRLALRKESS
jgi:hypothetical protein